MKYVHRILNVTNIMIVTEEEQMNCWNTNCLQQTKQHNHQTANTQNTRPTAHMPQSYYEVWVWNSVSGTWQMFEYRELNLILLMGSQIHVAVVMNVTEILGIWHYMSTIWYNAVVI